MDYRLRNRRITPGFPVIIFFLIFCSPLHTGALEPEGDPGTGVVTGSIKLYRTRVITEGGKSDRDVIVYLKKVHDTVSPPLVEKTVSMDQKGLIFLPHVLPVQTGTTVEFLNSDNVDHNVYFLSETTGKTLDLGTWPQGVSVKHTFSEKDEVIILCKLHLEMAAYVVVLDTPYFFKTIIDETSQEATYRITGVTPGRYRINTWHKKLVLQEGPWEIEVAGRREISADLVITKKKYAR